MLKPEGVVSKIVTGAGRFSVHYGAHEHPGFCVVLQGSCWLAVEGAEPVEIGEGDFVLLPSSPSFVLASDLEAKPRSVDPVDEDVLYGPPGAAPTVRMMGGYFRFDRANARLLLRFLPVLVHVRRGEGGSARLRRIVELISEEARGRLPGRDLVVERMVEGAAS